MSESTPDRRQTRRLLHSDEHGIVSTRVRPGHRARLIDVSADGALIETNHRLLPGTCVELHVETRSHRTNVRGRVLRCAIVLVRPSWVCYRGAIGFDRHLPWLLDEDRGAMAFAATRSALPDRAVATREVI
jgi:PilZ domain-containing protein